VKRKCRLWIVALDVSYVLLVALFQISACLSHICVCMFYTCVNSTLVVVSSSVVPGLDKLQYSVIVFKCYFEVCTFKEIGYFPDLWTIICEGGFFLFALLLVLW